MYTMLQTLLQQATNHYHTQLKPFEKQRAGCLSCHCTKNFFLSLLYTQIYNCLFQTTSQLLTFLNPTIPEKVVTDTQLKMLNS